MQRNLDFLGDVVVVEAVVACFALELVPSKHYCCHFRNHFVCRHVFFYAHRLHFDQLQCQLDSLVAVCYCRVVRIQLGAGKGWFGVVVLVVEVVLDMKVE